MDMAETDLSDVTELERTHVLSVIRANYGAYASLLPANPLNIGVNTCSTRKAASESVSVAVHWTTSQA